ncbi:S8 family serine peptidase [Hyphomonas sp.]|uniref:S8 family serine peptidase n=1 Tax=Hyphomonas sp. TaxID=87 RepID=UPI003918EEA7
MKLYALLTATLVIGAALAAPANASGERDSGERAAERLERDRAERAERSERDASKREGREDREDGRDDDRDDRRDPSSLEDKDRDRDTNDTGDDKRARDDRDDDVPDESGRDESSGSDDEDDDLDNSGSGSSSDLDDDSDDDDDQSGSGSGSSGSDDDDDDSDDDNDEDDSDDKRGETGRLSFDDNGQLYRDRELVVLLTNDTELSRIAGMGFDVIETRKMRRDDGLVARIGFPADMGAREALDRLRANIPDAPSAYNHVYKASGETPASGLRPKPAAPFSSAPAGLVAVIDGFSGGTVLSHDVKPFVRHRAEIPHGDNVVSVLVNDLVALGYASPERLLAADVVEQVPGAAPAASIIGLIDALDWASAEGAQVINISLTGPANPVLETVVNEIARDGALIIAAVGNSGPATKPGFPAAYDSVMGITAVDSSGAPYIYAARGAQVELSAEAVAIAPGAGGEKLSGTSFAAPRISALAATLMRGQSAGDVRAGLRLLAADLGAPGRDDVFGYGAVPPPPDQPRLAEADDLQKKLAQ